MTPEKHLELILEYKNSFTEAINNYINQHFSDTFVLVAQITIKSLIVMFFFLLLDFLFSRLLNPILKKAIKESEQPMLPVLVKRKIFRSLFRLIPAFLAFMLIPYIFYHHPKSFEVTNKIFSVFLLAILMQLGHRFLNVVEDLSTDENNYRSIAVNSFGQLIRIISIVIVLFVIISIVFNVSASQIFTVIGAITAIFLLVFRDPILGFVAGIHAASSRMVKKGDWVYFPKYNLEGYVKEINLISIKIESFDKTFSTIPTYDIISSELKNNEPIHKNNRRMIKRSIFLNINSFKFLGNEDLKKFEENILIGNYIKKKQNEYSQMNLNQPATPQLVQKQLTNIGLFRVYVYQYLLIHNHIVKDDILLVRQREISTQGLPLEIFCFANTSEWEAYEKIQSDIFDFILTSAKEFGLEVVQTGLK